MIEAIFFVIIFHIGMTKFVEFQAKVENFGFGVE